MADEILIIGGGFAGLSAGVVLSGAGRRVRLLEEKPYLGGRARSFVDPSTGSVVDNGQHLFMGCYRATRRFLGTIGTLDSVRFQPRLSVHFLDEERRLSALVCPGLPGPWHLLVGVLRSNSFTHREKLEVLRLGSTLRSSAGRNGAEHKTVAKWLAQSGQSESLRRKFWDLLCIAAMNEDPEIASATLFARVLRLALFNSPEDSSIGIARVGLSDCYTRAAKAFIEVHQGSVECDQNVKSVLVSGGVCQGVELNDGARIEARTILAAVPWHRLPSLLPREWHCSEPGLAGIAALGPAPIISINLWFDRPITDLEFVGLRGTTIQWLFNKGAILGTGENYLSLVLSGAHEHVRRSNEELREVALKDMSRLFPAMRDAKLLHSLVLKERFATFSPTCEAEPLRPGPTTSVRGFYLAGDWTATGLPATIEGAVQSGYTAAEIILQAG
jgi:hydroxysqualene dehydroxylase